MVTHHQYGISALVSQTSFRGETSDGVARCRLFSQAIRNRNTWYLFIFAVRPEILDRHLRYIMHGQGIEGYAMAHAAVRRNTISSLTVKRGYNLILLCTVVGKPTPHITWTKNRVLIRNDTRHLLLPNGVLLVRQVDIKESGHYKCVATNAVGKDQGSVRLTVKNLAVGWYFLISIFNPNGIGRLCILHKRCILLIGRSNPKIKQTVKFEEDVKRKILLNLW